MTDLQPIILAIETATHILSVALLRGDTVLADVKWQAGSIHAEKIVPTCTEQLDVSGLTWADIDAIAVSQGPGSFTSLRIGFGTAKGVSLAHDLPLILIPTLEAIASQVPYCRYPVCAVLDARKDEVYAAWFDTSDGVAVRLTDDSLYSPQGFGDLIREKTVIVGNGWERYGSDWTESLGDLVAPAPAWTHLPSAAAVGVIAADRFMNGYRDDPGSAVPAYLRRSQAQELKGKNTQTA